MQIHGFLKTTLLDYPGQVACTIFCGSCNFRCPYCHNSELVLHPNEMPLIGEEEIFSHLQKRKGILDGVCITGGEATLQADLVPFIEKIKELGYLVKLDTNGYRPDVLKELCEKQLLDYVAMDIKHSREKYYTICRMDSFSLAPIETSVNFLKEGHVPYEFRTTVIKELHTPQDLCDIARWISEADAYYLQSYRDSEEVMERRFSAYSTEEFLKIEAQVKQILPCTKLRGIETED
ncbi:MAG: anaerobic ribonucleoside-triphosphate reductase activating protein [Lachnospiraceae bacterium]